MFRIELFSSSFESTKIPICKKDKFMLNVENCVTVALLGIQKLVSNENCKHVIKSFLEIGHHGTYWAASYTVIIFLIINNYTVV